MAGTASISQNLVHIVVRAKIFPVSGLSKDNSESSGDFNTFDPVMCESDDDM